MSQFTVMFESICENDRLVSVARAFDVRAAMGADAQAFGEYIASLSPNGDQAGIEEPPLFPPEETQDVLQELAGWEVIGDGLDSR